MPAVNIGNDIIKAFLAGRQLAQERLENEQRQAQLKVQNEQAVKVFEEQRRQFEEEAKESKRRFDLQQKALSIANELEAEKQRSALYEKTALTGLTPPGYNISKVKPSFPGQYEPAEVYTSYRPKNIESTLPELENVPDWETYARRLARIEEISGEPKLKGQLLVKEIERIAEENKAKALHDSRMKQIELQNKGRLEAARISRRSPEEMAKIRRESFLDTPLDPNVQRDVFGLPYSIENTPRNLSGSGMMKPLTPSQLEKATDFQELERKTREFKALMEKKSEDGVELFDKYYKGLTLGGLYAAGKGLTVSESADIAKATQLAASIESDAKNLIGKHGAALTATEKSLLEKQSISPNRLKTSGDARAITNGFLNDLEERRKTMIEKSPNTPKRPSLEEIYGIKPPG